MEMGCQKRNHSFPFTSTWKLYSISFELSDPVFSSAITHALHTTVADPYAIQNR